MKIFSTAISVVWANLCLLIVRLAISGFMFTHGWPKLAKLNAGGEIQFADPFGVGPTISLGLVVFAEVLCPIFIIIGLGTRLAVIPLIINMLVAAFYALANDPFSGKEKALLFLVVFIMLFVFGSGRYSVDHLVSKKPRA